MDGGGQKRATNEVDVAGRASATAVGETIYSEKLEFGLLRANNLVAICADEAFPRTLSNGSGRRAIEPLGKPSTVGARWVNWNVGWLTGTVLDWPERDRRLVREIRGHRRAIFRRRTAAACRPD